MQPKPQRTAAEIARETIKRLAGQRIAPTPENFSATYHEIAGTSSAQPAAACDWPKLTTELVRNLDLSHSGWTPARKRESVQHVLSAFGADAQKTYDRLSGLMRSWNTQGAEQRPAVAAAAVQDVIAEPANTKTASILPVALAPVEGDASAGNSPRALRRDEADACERLAGLLRLLCNNVAALAPDAAWLRGQMERVDLLLTPPLDSQRLSEAEASLRAAIQSQTSLRDELEAAKLAIKEILTTLIDRLGSMADATGDYYQRVGGYSMQIEKADDLVSLGQVVRDLLGDTERMQRGIRHTHEELIETKRKSETYATRVRDLENELARVSDLVKTDQLTQVLNRRGFDEAIGIEVARAQRQDSALCLAMMDIDNFKRLNDAHGHQVGDQALIHLMQVVRQVIRPTDIVARLGGEEFVVLLPRTFLDEAVAVMARLQRQLTREFFLDREEKLFITFSAGVAEFKIGETREEVLERADRALYEAKRQGKNRVVAAQPASAKQNAA